MYPLGIPLSRLRSLPSPVRVTLEEAAAAGRKAASVPNAARLKARPRAPEIAGTRAASAEAAGRSGDRWALGTDLPRILGTVRADRSRSALVSDLRRLGAMKKHVIGAMFLLLAMAGCGGKGAVGRECAAATDCASGVCQFLSMNKQGKTGICTVQCNGAAECGGGKNMCLNTNNGGVCMINFFAAFLNDDVAQAPSALATARRSPVRRCGCG